MPFETTPTKKHTIACSSVSQARNKLHNIKYPKPNPKQFKMVTLRKRKSGRF